TCKHSSANFRDDISENYWVIEREANGYGNEPGLRRRRPGSNFPPPDTGAVLWRGDGLDPAIFLQRALEQRHHLRSPFACREVAPLLHPRNQALHPIDVKADIPAKRDRLIAEIHVDG